MRPDAAATIAGLAASGRLQVGPWMILMDEFMVSGETLVRDLQMGLGARHDLGGASPVGYLPTCSVTSRRCRSYSASPASSTRSYGGRARGGRRHRVLVGGA